MIRTNGLMNNYINKATEFEEDMKNLLVSIKLPTNLIEVDDCVLLIVNDIIPKSLDLNFINKVFGDKTGYEAYNNHLHISSVVECEILNPYHELLIGIDVIELWEQILIESFPSEKFILILSFDGVGAVARFHKYRVEEANWVDPDDIEMFKEGILYKSV